MTPAPSLKTDSLVTETNIINPASSTMKYIIALLNHGEIFCLLRVIFWIRRPVPSNIPSINVRYSPAANRRLSSSRFSIRVMSAVIQISIHVVARRVEDPTKQSPSEEIASPYRARNDIVNYAQATALQNAASPPLNFHGKTPSVIRLLCSSFKPISPPRFSTCIQSCGNKAL